MFTSLFRDEVYGTYITILTGDREKIKSVVTDYDPKFDGDMDFLGRCIESRKGDDHHVIVMLPDWPCGQRWDAKNLSILVHELFHATEFVMWYHDIDHSVETQEAWAYYLDHLMRRALEVLP